MIVNLFFSNAELYKRKVYIDFNFYIIIFFMVGNFKTSFQIQCIGNQSTVCKVILKEKIVFYSKETVYVQMDYIGLLKKCLFIMIVIYPAVPNVFFDMNILWIVVIINLINKAFIFSRDMCFDTIYKCVDISYIMINITKAFTTIVVASTTVSKPFSTV